MGYNDLFSEINKQTNAPPSASKKNAASDVRNSGFASVVHSFENSDIDAEWAAGYKESAAQNPYYDYYFSGQDIKVSIEGVDKVHLPIETFGFNVEQQKVPVYGLWSYTYDAVMRGTRIVNGTFTISTQGTDYMRNILSSAAAARANRGIFSRRIGVRELTEDDNNIDKYWSKNLDGNLGQAGKNIFSVHPPFTFVVDYGIQNTIIDGSWDPDYDGLYGGDQPLSQDVNERIVKSPQTDRSFQFIIEACELTSQQVGYAPDGSVATETYQFFARDLIIPPVNT